MSDLVSVPNHGARVVSEEGRALAVLQRYLDDITLHLNDDRLVLKPYTVTTLPAAASNYGLVMVTDETGGAVPAFSDLTDWRRVTDRTIVS